MTTTRPYFPIAMFASVAVHVAGASSFTLAAHTRSAGDGNARGDVAPFELVDLADPRDRARRANDAADTGRAPRLAPVMVMPARPHHSHPYPVAPDHDAVMHDAAAVHVPKKMHVPPTSPPRDQAPEPVSAPRPVASPPHEPPHFAMTLRSSDGADAAALASASGNHRSANSEGASTSRAEKNVDVPGLESNAPAGLFTAPRLRERHDVAYPREARAAGIEGDVVVELVIDERGDVTGVAPIHPLDDGDVYGLVKAAVATAKRYRFAPATRGGVAVPSRLRWTVQFRLQ